MKSTLKYKPLRAISAVLLAVLASHGNAEVFSIDITAIVEYVDDYKNYLGGKVKAGDQITGTYVYDTATADDNTLESVGDYWHYKPGFGVCLSVAGLKFGSNPTNPSFLVELVNEHTSNIDNYLIRSYNNLFAISVPQGPNSINNGNHISWQLDDNTQQALSNTLLGDQPPKLADWKSWAGLSIESRNQEDRFAIRAHVASAVRGSSTSIGNCANEPVAGLPPKFIDSTVLHRGTNIVDKSEAVLYNDKGIYSIATRNLSTGVSGKTLRVPELTGLQPIGLLGIKDTDANTYPDIALLYTNGEGKTAHIYIIDSFTGVKIRAFMGLDPQLIARSLELIPDINRNGFEEIGTLYEAAFGQGVTATIDSKTGATISVRQY